MSKNTNTNLKKTRKKWWQFWKKNTHKNIPIYTTSSTSTIKSQEQKISTKIDYVNDNIKNNIIKNILLGKQVNNTNKINVLLSIEDIHVLNAFIGLIHDSENFSTFYSSMLNIPMNNTKIKKNKDIYTKMKVIEQNIKLFEKVKIIIKKKYDPYTLYIGTDSNRNETIKQLLQLLNVITNKNVTFFFKDHSSLKKNIDDIIKETEPNKGINLEFIKKYIKYFNNLNKILPNYLSNNNATKRMVNYVRNQTINRSKIKVNKELFLYDALKTIIWNILRTEREKNVRFSNGNNRSKQAREESRKRQQEEAERKKKRKKEEAERKRQQEEAEHEHENAIKQKAAIATQIQTPSHATSFSEIYLPTYTLNLNKESFNNLNKAHTFEFNTKNCQKSGTYKFDDTYNILTVTNNFPNTTNNYKLIYEQLGIQIDENIKRILINISNSNINIQDIIRQLSELKLSVNIKIVNSSIDIEIANHKNENAFFILPSQFNGAEYTSNTNIIKKVQDYLRDLTGGPIGQLSCDLGVAQYIIDNAANDQNPTGFNTLKLLIDSLKHKHILQNGYLQIAKPDNIDEDFNKNIEHFSNIATLGFKDISVIGYNSGTKNCNDLKHKVSLIYGSAVPLFGYYKINENTDYNIRIANLLMISQYYGALYQAYNYAKTNQKKIKIFLMPLGGGVFYNQPKHIFANMILAIYLLNINYSDYISFLDIKILTYNGKPNEYNEYNSFYNELKSKLEKQNVQSVIPTNNSQNTLNTEITKIYLPTYTLEPKLESTV